MNKKILLAGPWVGEFGWELFCWHAHIRRLSKNFDETVIISKKGHEFLYKDFYTKYYVYNTPKNSFVNMWLCNDVNAKSIVEKSINHLGLQGNVTIQLPINLGFTINGKGEIKMSENFKKQKFIKLKSDTLDKSYDILIHPRSRHVANERNWDINKWNKLVKMLENDYSIATIGSYEALGIDGTADMRGIPIEDTVALMNRAKLIIGPSSGPMHLASLSGLQHFVWSSEHNRNRYLTAWNPFNTKVHFYSKESWNPKVDVVYNKIKEII
ncbi:MAG: hypothetical protein ACOCVF_02140 [bacterium]